ncbi:uncharacterized protein SCHCODRAFT_01147061 [Schizophyllum commune H4-8]|uniref:uncharacterized protein n=1 Tax=Schizophyllum commune (strain H4-8 / FGSC 9210) TaxID=578458 RepID=UPI00215F29D1|nr:uncharacterized protein SCHCODRAFT_01147061 [Schizophyllum commune H4-8]KAI5899244.1 hypothetical protein SCHCODRAFT_01147061 [Schizophyllum commune H4-8]
MNSPTGTLSDIQLQDMPANIDLDGCLLHNDSPDSDQKVALLRLLRDLEARVRALDQTSTDEPTWADHVEEPSPLDHELQLCHMALNSPIRLMPNELLACILRHVPHKRSSPASVFKHVQVCQRWRAVALEEPQIWTKLTLEDSQATGANAVEQVHAWFRRAHPLPVSFTILRPWGHGRRRADSAHILDESILPLTSQMSTLDIDGTLKRVLSFTRHPPCSFPELVRLRLNLPHKYRGDSPLPCSIFADLGQLRALSIGSLHSLTQQCLDVAIPAPWEQLQELELDCISDVHDMPRIFLQCRSLRRAVLRYGYRPLHLPQPPPSPVEFPYLETLTLKSERWLGALLDAVLLPSLTAFDVELGEYRPGHISWAAWSQLETLARRAPDLQSLTMRHIDFMGRDVAFASLLECVPQLERLVLVDVTADPTCLLPLFYDERELVPQLRVLRFDRLDVGINDMEEAGPIYAEAYELLYELLEYRDFRSVRGEFSIDWKAFDYEEMPLDICEDQVYLLRDIVGHYEDGTIIDVEDVEGIIERIQSREDGYCTTDSGMDSDRDY